MDSIAPPTDVAETVRRALAEDIGSGDVTAQLIHESAAIKADVRCRDRAILCGTAWFDEVFHQLDPAVKVRWQAREGKELAPDTRVCRISGPARAILSGERTALNFLQTLSGTATSANRFVSALEGLDCQVLDTRKTLPGLRAAQKYAVLCGGASNHRMGLHDAVLIKENHIVAAGSIAAAVAAARAAADDIRVEIEVESLDQISDALAAGADMLLLDNFKSQDLRRAVDLTRESSPRTLLEASGGIDLKTIRMVAETGVDFVSVGTMTKHLTAIDFSMRFLP